MNNNSTNSSHQAKDVSRRINIVYNSMIVVSILMIIASIIAVIGVNVWLHNFSAASGGKEPAYSIGAQAGTIGGILVIIFGILSILLFIYRIILQKRLENTTLYPVKRMVSLILFVASLLPPIIVILIGVFRFL